MEKMFKFIDDDNQEKEAEVLSIITVDSKEYMLYSVPTDQENVVVCAAQYTKNADGTYNLKNLDETDNKEKIKQIVSDYVKEV